jgi:hypothetical protein
MREVELALCWSLRAITGGFTEDSYSRNGSTRRAQTWVELVDLRLRTLVD